jgi:hypothetical protein
MRSLVGPRIARVITVALVSVAAPARAAAAGPEPASGGTCELSAPALLAPRPGAPKGARLAKGALIELVEPGPKWTKVRAASKVGFVKTSDVLRCKARPPRTQEVAELPAPQPAPPATPPPEPEASQLTSAPSPVQDEPEPPAVSVATRELHQEVTAAPSEVRRGVLRLAVYDLELQGIDATVGRVVTDSLVAEVRKLENVAAIGMVEIQQMLSHEATKQLLGCDNTSCLAEISGALGVDDILTGSVSRVAGGEVLTVRRIDQARSRVAGTVNRRLEAGSGQELLLAVGPAVQELFPEAKLRAGTKRGVPDEVALRLDPPPLPKWSIEAAGGATLAALALGGVFAWSRSSAQSDYRSYASLGTREVIDGAELTRKRLAMEAWAGRTNAMFIGAGALALTTGIMALFTDWHGYRDARPVAAK